MYEAGVGLGRGDEAWLGGEYGGQWRGMSSGNSSLSSSLLAILWNFTHIPEGILQFGVS